MTSIIIGLGTGRCGTRSFTKLLNEQQDVFATHEGKSKIFNFIGIAPNTAIQ